MYSLIISCEMDLVYHCRKALRKRQTLLLQRYGFFLIRQNDLGENQSVMFQKRRFRYLCHPIYAQNEGMCAMFFRLSIVSSKCKIRYLARKTIGIFDGPDSVSCLSIGYFVFNFRGSRSSHFRVMEPAARRSRWSC